LLTAIWLTPGGSSTVLRVILRINNDYFPKQLCNEDSVFSGGWKYKADELRASKGEILFRKM
jgi:hypothetical protein